MALHEQDDQDCSGDAFRRLALRMCDLRLLSTAANYDLADKAQRKRSVEDLATFFFRASQALAPGLFIEAGAKDARASRRAARYLDGARVVAFEANPYTYKRFQTENAGYSRIEYLHLALSDQPGPVTFNVTESDDGKPRPDGIGSLMEHGPSFDSNFVQVTVEATTLDHYFAGYEFDSCALWIDVEGAARYVLSGGRAVLEKAAVLIIEVEDRALWKDAWTQSDVAAFLYDAGMLPVARDFQSRYQYNVVFVRESLLDHPYLRLRLAQNSSTLAGARHALPAGRSAGVPSSEQAAPDGARARSGWRRAAAAVLPPIVTQAARSRRQSDAR